MQTVSILTIPLINNLNMKIIIFINKKNAVIYLHFFSKDIIRLGIYNLICSNSTKLEDYSFAPIIYL